MTTKIALVGLGYLGKIHLKLLTENTNWQLTGIFDTDKKLCTELSQQYNIKAFASYDELLENCDAVDIVTPIHTHFDYAQKAIVNGKHVLIEKPVTSTLKQARQLQQLVSEARVCLQVGHVERFNPAFTAAMPYLQNPRFIEIHRLAQYNPRSNDVSVVFDLMLHDLDLVLSIVKSNIKRISASGAKLVSPSADMVNARIEFANGAVANITANRIALKNVRKFRVFTENNFLTVNLLDKITEVVKLKPASTNPKNMVIDPGSGLPKKEIAFEHPIILPTNAINEVLNTFHTSICSNRQSVVSIDNSITLMELAQEIEEKIST